VEDCGLTPINTGNTTAFPALSRQGTGDNLLLSQHPLATRQRHPQVEEDTTELQHSSTRVTETTRRQPALRASAGQSATTRHKTTNIAIHDESPRHDDKVSMQTTLHHVKVYRPKARGVGQQ
jgi:hypothetical protein